MRVRKVEKLVGGSRVQRYYNNPAGRQVVIFDRQKLAKVPLEWSPVESAAVEAVPEAFVDQLGGDEVAGWPAGLGRQLDDIHGHDVLLIEECP